ncbi:MAG: hypothetical protein MI723_10360 [Caulobacterales bacterium]|nr:hypothetical protein [Caulobacterales bacterium]
MPARVQKRLIGAALLAAGLVSLAWAVLLSLAEWRGYALSQAIARLEAAGQTGERRAAARADLTVLLERGAGVGPSSPGYWDDRARAFLLLASAAAPGGAERRALLDQAEAAAHASLARRPGAHGPWSRLAAIDLGRDGRLDAPGAHALANARRSAPYREELALWRLRFSLPLWRQLSEESRDGAARDAVFVLSRARWFARPGLERELAGLPPDVAGDLQARLAARAPEAE